MVSHLTLVSLHYSGQNLVTAAEKTVVSYSVKIPYEEKVCKIEAA